MGPTRRTVIIYRHAERPATGANRNVGEAFESDRAAYSEYSRDGHARALFVAAYLEACGPAVPTLPSFAYAVRLISQTEIGQFPA
jgi:hypothetical protein